MLASIRLFAAKHIAPESSLAWPDWIINPSPWLLTLVAIIPTWFIAWYYGPKLLSKWSRKPYWHIETENLVADRIAIFPTIEVLYKKQSMDNLSVSTLTFWNAGGEPIEQSHVRAGPIAVIPAKSDVTILGCDLVGSNELTSQIAVSMDPANNRVLVTFDGLDRDEGGIFRVLHTGKSSSALHLTGKVYKVKKIRRIEHRYTARVYSLILLAAIPTLASLLSGGPTTKDYALHRILQPLNIWLSGILTGFVIVAFIMTKFLEVTPESRAKSWWQRMPFSLDEKLFLRRVVPKTLESVDVLPFKALALTAAAQSGGTATMVLTRAPVPTDPPAEGSDDPPEAEQAV